jgi:hypothetical protein
MTDFFLFFKTPAYISGYRGDDASSSASVYATRYPEANTLLKEGVFVFLTGMMGCWNKLR